jgi:ketosteroid isomerase-like protein
MRSSFCTIALFTVAITALGQSDPAAVKHALLRVDREFNTATQAHRLDGWMQYFDDDSVSQQAKPVVGKEAIRAVLKEQWDNPNFHLTWDPDEAYPMPNGKMGYTRGHWTLTSKDEKGTPLKRTGEYLTVWHQNEQGEWKVAWDGGAADPPKHSAEKK